MSNFLFIPILIISLFACSAQNTAGNQAVSKESFFVAGECSMCETRIVKTAMKLKGVETASWDGETKLLTIVFHPSITSLGDVHKAMAAVGHDTELEKASDEVYEKLPDCCHYPRLKPAQ